MTKTIGIGLQDFNMTEKEYQETLEAREKVWKERRTDESIWIN